MSDYWYEYESDIQAAEAEAAARDAEAVAADAAAAEAQRAAEEAAAAAEAEYIRRMQEESWAEAERQRVEEEQRKAQEAAELEYAKQLAAGTLNGGGFTGSTLEEYTTWYNAGLASYIATFTTIGGMLGGFAGLVGTLGVGSIITALGGAATGMEVGAALWRATHESIEAWAARQNQGATITGGTDPTGGGAGAGAQSTGDDTTKTTTDPTSGATTTTVKDPDTGTVTTTTTTGGETTTTITDAGGDTTTTTSGDDDQPGEDNNPVINEGDAANTSGDQPGTAAPLPPVVAVGGGTYGPAVSANLDYATLSDEEQIRLAIQKGMFEESAGQQILDMKVQQAYAEGNIRYSAAARGLAMKGTPTMQLQAQRQTANQAIGLAERQLAGSVSGMDWTAQAAKDRAALAQKEKLQSIDFSESAAQQNAWVSAFGAVTKFATSLLNIYWTPNTVVK